MIMPVQRIDLPLAAHPEVSLNAAAASVSIRPSPDATGFIEVRGHRVVEVDVEREGERVIANLRAGFFDGHVRIDLYLPASAQARVAAKHGNIGAESLTGVRLDLETAAGNIHLDQVQGELRLRCGAGSITAHGCAGRFDVETHAGSAKLDIVSLAAGVHRVHSHMGAVKVALAPGIAVRIEAESHMGSVRNRYPSTETADAILSLSTQMGSVRVRESGESEVSDWLDVDTWMAWAEKQWMQAPKRSFTMPTFGSRHLRRPRA